LSQAAIKSSEESLPLAFFAELNLTANRGEPCQAAFVHVLNSSDPTIGAYEPSLTLFPHKKEGRAMADIRAEVAHPLHWDLAIPRHRISARVDGGWVTLQGKVDWAYQKSCRRGGRAPCAWRDRRKERNRRACGGRSFQRLK